MRKRILVVESADAVRGIAETVLRQNGYEVISVASIDRADEILHLSRPDLVIVGSELRTAGQTPYYEKLLQDPNSASLPLLLLAPSEAPDLPFPEESVIPQPLDPKLFLEKVSAFAGRTDVPPSVKQVSPLGESVVDDEFLDAALGLDQIDVTDSEMMNKTSLGRLKTSKASPEKLVGYDHFVDDDEGLSETSRIDSLIIEEDTTTIGHKAGVSRTPPPVSATSKLEIAEDQYGLEKPDAASASDDSESAHDYDWFVNSMRDEAETSASSASIVEPQVPEPPQPKESSGSSDVSSGIAETASAVPGVRGDRKSGGVDEFIDEFKKEMELLRSNEPESVVVQGDSAQPEDARPVLAWEERLEKLSAEEVGLFTTRFVSELSEKIARKLVDRIDPDEFLRLIKEEVVRLAQKKP